MSIYEVFDMSIALWLEIISPLLTILMAELYACDTNSMAKHHHENRMRRLPVQILMFRRVEKAATVNDTGLLLLSDEYWGG
jgi:hypothetical protein